ncbi:MAG: gliding motility-associated C-terminal domain-containing protein, partial [Bacteroidota bacterium]
CTDESVNIRPTTLEAVNNLAIDWQALEGTILSETQNLSIDVGAPGTYVLQVEDLTNSCIIEDTLRIVDNRILPMVANLNDRMLSCTNASITLDASGSDFGSNIVYAWLDEAGNTLSNNTILLVDEAGNYILEVTNLENSCVNTDTLLVGENINPPRSANLVLEAPSCDGTDDGYLEILDVVGGTQPYNYQLNTANPQGSAIFSDLAPNTYQLMIVDELGCEWDTIFTLQEPDAIEVSIEQSSDNLITGQSVDLTVLTSVPEGDIAEIIWSPEDLTNCFDCSTINASLVGPTEVGVTIVDINGCENNAVRKIDVGLAPVPNAITPNGDGDNDVFMVPAIEAAPDAFPDSEFIVFNRWGDVLYRVSPYNNDWDGRNQDGKTLSEGTYYYVLRLDTREGEFLKGDITILRR